MSDKVKIIYFRENFLQSVLADLATFIIMGASITLNELFVGSKFLNGLIVVMLILFIITKTNDKKHTFYSKEDFLKYLDEE